MILHVLIGAIVSSTIILISAHFKVTSIEVTVPTVGPIDTVISLVASFYSKVFESALLSREFTISSHPECTDVSVILDRPSCFIIFIIVYVSFKYY